MTMTATSLAFRTLLESRELPDASCIGNDDFDSYYWSDPDSNRVCTVHVYEDRYEVEVDVLSGKENDYEYVDYKTPLGAYKRAAKEALRQYEYYNGLA